MGTVMGSWSVVDYFVTMKVQLALVLLLAAFANLSSASSRFRGRNLHREPIITANNASAYGRLLLSQTITQKVDHFDDTNTDTWQMRYFSNSQHYAPGGPFFIYLGGEWEITYGSVTGGHMYDMAKEMNGYIFYTEHRYYGKSHPTSDASTANLKYLDVDQALADVAHFVDYQRATITGASNSGVIVVGGSYSATMAAWFRQKYPDKANGAWASSAPLNAQLDFPEYKEVMSSAIEQVGEEGCADRIRTAFAQIEQEIASGQVASITEKFNLCQDINPADNLDVWQFFYIVTDEFAGLVQYHHPVTGHIQRACSAIMDPAISDPVEAVGKWVSSLFSPNCVDTSYASYIEEYKSAAWTDDIMRLWIYQTCNEFGWYQTSTSNDQLFGSKFPLELNIQMCADLFDNQFTEASILEKIAQTNRNHNGFAPDVTNVFFTHGEVDPWRPMGVQEDVNSETPVVILEGHAHCQDLQSISSTDSLLMRTTKEQITANVRKWLGM